MKYDVMNVSYNEYTAIYKSAVKVTNFKDFKKLWGVKEELLKPIWETAHTTPHQIRMYLGLSVTEFSQWGLINRRTVEEWELHKEKHGTRYCALMIWRSGMYPEPYTNEYTKTVDRESLGLSDKQYYDIFTDAVSLDSPTSLLEKYDLEPSVVETIYKTAHVTPKEIRMHLNLSQAKFASWALVQVSAVQMWEYGTRKATPGWNAFLAWRAGLYPEP